MPKLVDHDARRAEVATLAQDVICEQGLASLTLRDVAGKGGWSPTAVTHYFRNREELLVFTLQHSRDEAGRRVAAAMEGGTDLLQATIEQTLPLDEPRRRQWQVWLAFWGSAVGSPALASVQSDAQRRFRGQLRTGLEARGFEGDLDHESGRLVALVDGIAVQATFAPKQWPADRQLAQFSNHLS